MAINLSGFFGGLGEGFGAYQKEQRGNEQIKFERDSELERQRLARLADKRGEEATVRQTKAEERLLAQSEYGQGLGIFNQIEGIARADADDDVTTARFLRSPGLDDISRKQEVDNRIQRYNQRQQLITTLSGQGKVTQTFGDVSTLLRPSQFTSPDFKMPKPMIDPAQLKAMTDAELQKIIKAPGPQKADATAQARKRLGYFADNSYLDANIPEFGKDLGFGGARSSKALENPQQFFQENPDFRTGVGGEKILSTGAKQVVKYVNGIPQVEYQRPLKADYVEPQADALRSGILNKQLEFLTRTMDPRVEAENLKKEKLKWGNLLSGKQFEWYDKTQTAKISKLRSSAGGASDALRRMSIMLAHQDRQDALSQRKTEFKLEETRAWERANADFDRNLKALKDDKNALALKAANATDLALGGTRSAAIDAMKRVDAEIATMESQRRGLRNRDLNVANQVLGGQYTPSSQLDATTMLSDQQTQQQNAIMAYQMGMAGPRYQQQPAPQAPAPMVFAPNISLGGMQGGVGVPGVPPGGGGVPGVPPGGGGGPVFDPNAPPANPVTPIAYEKILAGLISKFPKVAKQELESAARSISSNPALGDMLKQNLKLKNDQNKGDGKKRNVEGYPLDKDGRAYRLDKVNGRAIYVDAQGNDITGQFPAPPPVNSSEKLKRIPNEYKGWTLNGSPYTGPQYDGYPISRAEYQSRIRSGMALPAKLQWAQGPKRQNINVEPEYDASRFDYGGD